MRFFRKSTFRLPQLTNFNSLSASAFTESSTTTTSPVLEGDGLTVYSTGDKPPQIVLDNDSIHKADIAVEAKPLEELEPIKDGELPDTKLTIDAAKYEQPPEKHWIYRRLYILNWLQKYDRETAISDLIAGITLGLTIIPQSIAYAALAGLSSEYGLYSAIIGQIFYAIFGTIPQVSIGPTSLMSLMVLQFVGDRPVQFVVVLSFLAGLVEFLMGAFQLGFIVNFIPTPVTKAFTSATAVIVAAVQVKNLLGIKTKGVPSIEVLFRSIRYSDTLLGLVCLTALLSLRQLSHISIKKNTPTTRILKRLLWYISISRNALVVFLCSLGTFLWVKQRSAEAIPYALTAKVNSAQLELHLPPFAFDYKNTTYMFSDIVSELGSGIIVVPIVAILANVAIAKAFVKDNRLEASQEMLTLGICNLAGSFFNCIPTCGAFTRSAVSQASGVRTPLCGIYTALMVYLALTVLTPYFGYIPKSSISAVLIAAVVFMIDFSPIKTLWNSNKKDFFSWVGCFIVCLFAGVQTGLCFGIVLNMVFVFLRLGNPKVDVTLMEIESRNYIFVSPTSDVYYSGIEYIRDKINDACLLYRDDFPVVLDCRRFVQFDATFVDVLNALAKELEGRSVLLVLYGVNKDLLQLMHKSSNINFCDGRRICSDDITPKKPEFDGNGK
ncbi:sodium-independent sulfate anion transporter-like [Rhagoletis pomonella]|uniref:sodium-independent sulfate anion transporter-like n=1 Tax=Rhagoletis pomonella TaxID=28610 RepID=UPI00178365AE|nr:sodium-independent sulfate anion transporter-like [Rhagoletis pomonella]